jgi:mRNA interferase MazF
MKISPGEVYRVDLGYAGKVRMMTVVSLWDENAPRALVSCIPITSSYRGSWYEIPLSKKPFLRETSYANIQGIQAIQHHELIGPVGKLHANELMAIREALRRMLEIEPETEP